MKLNDHFYTRRFDYKGRTYWKCQLIKLKCRATAIVFRETPEMGITKQLHNHGPDQYDIQLVSKIKIPAAPERRAIRKIHSTKKLPKKKMFFSSPANHSVMYRTQIKEEPLDIYENGM